MSAHQFFANFDLSNFWDPADYYLQEYTDNPLTPEKIAEVEHKLGYHLPASYIELMTHRNGGAPLKANHRTSEPTSWANDHIAVTGFFSIGSAKRYSLCGRAGSTFWVENWGYPAIGIYFADCPSAGHDMLCLDYRTCGPNGEPSVVHVDQERNFKVTLVAENFESFVRGLEPYDSGEGG
jgi:hypothetical protein